MSLDNEDLVGRQEIAKRAGVTPWAVDRWRQRHPDFPAPEYRLSGFPIWRWEQVSTWLTTNGKLQPE